MTTDQPSTLGKLRAANGHPAPYRIKYLGIGNESWGCGGNMSADDYTARLKLYTTFVHNMNPEQALPNHYVRTPNQMQRIAVVEDEKHFEEYMKASIGQAGPVYKSRAENPYWKTDPNFEGMLQNLLRGLWVGYPGPMTTAAVEVQAQYVLCDMAGRVVVGGLTPEAALKEAHARVEEIYKVRGGKA